MGVDTYITFVPRKKTSPFPLDSLKELVQKIYNIYNYDCGLYTWKSDEYPAVLGCFETLDKTYCHYRTKEEMLTALEKAINNQEGICFEPTYNFSIYSFPIAIPISQSEDERSKEDEDGSEWYVWGRRHYCAMLDYRRRSFEEAVDIRVMDILREFWGALLWFQTYIG